MAKRNTRSGGAPAGTGGDDEATSSSPIRLFISHSSEDEELARALLGAIQGCMIVMDEHIRCTSVPGHKLEGGAHTSETLKSELRSADVVLGLVTQKSVNAQWVLFELGAAWGLGTPVKSLLGPGVGYESLPGPLKETNAFKLNKATDVSQLMDEIRSKLSASARPGPKQHEAIAALVDAANRLSEKSPS